jgi:hypothetical protein
MIYEFFFVTYALICCYCKFYEKDFSYLHEYFGFALGVNIYFFHDTPFIYDTEYLFSDTQPFEHINKQIICIIISLFLDLFINNTIKIDNILHHIGGITAYSIAIFGYNLGIVNNCVKNEITNIWLSLYKISKKSNNFILKKYLFPVSVILFIITYITYRIIPGTIMMIEILRNWDISIRNIYSQTQVVLYIIHICLQYFWFRIIIKQFFVIVREKFSNKIQ